MRHIEENPRRLQQMNYSMPGGEVWPEFHSRLTTLHPSSTMPLTNLPSLQYLLPAIYICADF
jgi:hypothetical protein